MSAHNQDTLAVSRMPHVLELNGIRAAAISIVAVAHFGLGFIVPGGFGVTLFFFLSGFLITSLLRIEFHNAGTISLRGFYWRRILRIIPPLWVSMAFSVFISPFIDYDTRVNMMGAAADLSFLTSYSSLIPNYHGFPGMPLWSLAIEEHFYLVFPMIVMWFLPRSTSTRLALWCAIACTGVLILRLVNVYFFGIVEANYYFTHTRVDSILFGCILALWNNPLIEAHPWKPGVIHQAAALLLLTIAFATRSPVFQETFRYTLQGIGLFILFTWILQVRVPIVTAMLRSRIAQWIGLLSYTLYLVHMLMFSLAKSLQPALHPILQAMFAALLAIGYSTAMYQIIERPLGLMRHRMNAKNEEVAAAS